MNEGPHQLCYEEIAPAEGGAPKCGQRSPGEGEDLDVREREFPSGGTEDPNEGGTVVWNCWVKRTDIDSVISPPMKETSQGMGRGIEFVRVLGMCGAVDPPHPAGRGRGGFLSLGGGRINWGGAEPRTHRQ